MVSPYADKRHRIRALACQLEVRMLVIDEIHSLLAGTFREQRIILNAIHFLPISEFDWFASELTMGSKRSRRISNWLIDLKPLNCRACENDAAFQQLLLNQCPSRTSVRRLLLPA